MKLDFALLADAASLGEGKLFIHGAPLKRIDVPQLPWGRAMAIAMSFSAEVNEAGSEHELELRIIGPPDAPRVIAAPPFPFRIVLGPASEIPKDVDQLGALAVVELGLVGFSVEGWYRVDLSLDSTPLQSLPLRVVLNEELQRRLMFSEPQTDETADASDAPKP